jgi:hypothetical protein
MTAHAREDERTVLSAIETLLKEQIHPEVRRYLRRLYLDATNQKDAPK